MAEPVAQPAGVELRAVEEADAEFVLEVYASTREAELALVPWSAEQKAAFARSQGELAERSYHEQCPGAEFLVVLVDGERAGRLYVWRTAEEIRVVDIALLPAYRGRGIGTALLRELFEESGRTGKPVRLHVEQFNPARRLYKRLGFEQLEDRGVYLFLERKPLT